MILLSAVSWARSAQRSGKSFLGIQMPVESGSSQALFPFYSLKTALCSTVLFFFFLFCSTSLHNFLRVFLHILQSYGGYALCLKDLRLSLASCYYIPSWFISGRTYCFLLKAGSLLIITLRLWIQCLPLIKQCHSREDEMVITIRVQAGRRWSKN